MNLPAWAVRTTVQTELLLAGTGTKFKRNTRTCGTYDISTANRLSIARYRVTVTTRIRVAIHDSFYTWWHKRNTQARLLGIRNIFSHLLYTGHTSVAQRALTQVNALFATGANQARRL